jgi:ABC-type dipeptide/oligopeptide/nickel transport system permease subunit
VSEAATTQGELAAGPGRERRLFTLWRHFRRNRLAVLGLVIVAVMVLTALFAPLIAPDDPRTQDYDMTLRPPGDESLMGTDALGSDVFSRVVYGARISLQASLISVGIAILVGVPLGLVAGYFRGFWDEWVVMRLVDSLQAIPFLILALVIAAILGGGLTYAMIAIGIGFVPAFVRITRAQVLTVRGLDYVQAARAVGAGNLRIMVGHVLPNSLPPLLVQTTLAMGYAIIAEATLSYLGLGAEPGEPSWGSMLFLAQSYLSVAWWMAFFPGMAIFFAVLGFNLLGDGVREALDPKTYR